MRISRDLAVVDGMVVGVGEVRYVVPVNAIRKIVMAGTEDLVQSSAGGSHSMLRFEDEVVQIRTLGTTWNGGNERSKQSFEGKLLVIVDRKNGRTAFPIDQLLGHRQVLVRPLEGRLAGAQHASGYALLGEGEVGIVLGHI